MAVYKGKDVNVSINGKIVAVAKSCTLSTSCDLIEISSGSAEWKEFMAGRCEWQVESSQFAYSPHEMSTHVGATFKIHIGRVTIEGDNRYISNRAVYGNAILVDTGFGAQVDGLMISQYVFKGTGPLEIGYPTE